jgi:hypothetical protein
MADATTNPDDASKNGIGSEIAPMPQQLAPVTGAAPAGRASEAAPVKDHGPQDEAANALNADITKILQEVKLPERRDTSTLEQRPVEQEPKKIDTSLGAAAMAERAAEIPAIVVPGTSEKKDDAVPAVHTLKNDLQDVVRDQKISVVRAASLEEDRRHHERSMVEEIPSQSRRSNRAAVIVFAAVLLLVLGAAALFGVYTVMQQRTGSASTAAIPSIVFAEQTIAFPLDGKSTDTVKQELAAARNTGGTALGSITRIVPTIATKSSDSTGATRLATFGEFMTAIGAHAPDDLIRSLGDNFFFGIHTVDTDAPVFVIPVTSYDHAFAGMLAWEPNMDGDLTPIFNAVPTITTDQNGLPVVRTFADVVMKNYDVRALKDDAGNIQLYYSFPTQSILVIAESPYTFTEILNRLEAARQL